MYHSPKPSTSNVPVASASANPPKPAGRKFTCAVCGGEGHPLRTCDKFLAMSAAERRTTIDRIQHCSNCLAFNHTETKCRSSHTCFTCGERHHSLLHANSSSAIQRTSAHAVAMGTSIPSSTFNAHKTQAESISSSNLLLATAIVTVLDVSGASHSLRALIDQGSEANFITESALTALQLPKKAVQAIISGIGSSHGQAKHLTSLTLWSQHNRSFNIDIEALVMGRITNLLPSSTVKPQRWEHLVDLTLADPSYYRSGRIDSIPGI